MPHQSAPALAMFPVAPSGQTWTVDALRSASDEDLSALFSGRDLRAQALESVLASLAGPWSGPTGVVRLLVELPDGDREAWAVRFGTSGARTDEHADPDAELRLPLVQVIRLLLGQADGALLHLAGTLEVDGDADLVLGLGTCLRPAGAARPLIAAAALDPVAVSAAIDGVRLEHLASVMAGGFRPLVLAEVFRRLPEFLIAEKAAGARVTVAFAIGGRPDGATDRYVVRVHDGECAVTPDAPADARVDATLVLEGHEFLRLVLGHLNPVRGVLSGDLRVEGHVIKALAFNSMMRIPGREVLAR